MNLSNYKPALAGVTESVERNRYHLQSYFLACNQISLENEAWWSFWKQLETDGDKDKLINEGEIGLSQAMLRAGATLSAMHRLGDLFETNSKKEDKILYLQNKKPEEINQTLHAWAKLLAKGCPIIKKQLFVGPGSEFAFLQNWNAVQMLLPDVIKQDFFNDLQRLLQSRYYELS
jgi:lipopolysaccharide biosynthesis protein